MSDEVKIEDPALSSEIIDLIPANQQIQPKAFIYDVKIPNGTKFSISVIAPSSTQAREALTQHMPLESVMSYRMTCEHIMQVQ